VSVIKPLKRALPIAAILIAVAVQVFIPNSELQPATRAPYFTYFLLFLLALYTALFILSFFGTALRKKLEFGGWFYTGAILFLTGLNVFTSKLAIPPVMYFPSLDRVFGALIDDSRLLTKCLAHSGRLLFFGYFGGSIVGLFTGIGIGFSKRMAYWLSPVIRLIGPIPSTVWIPLMLIVFPTAVSASAFIIALAVWFPVTLMTSSGISNVPQSYFDAGSTLGAGRFVRVAKIGVPASMPHIFLGLFNGACSSFITLITAELIGAKYGLGWYVNWEREMLSYSNVYAGLIVVALVFFLLVTGLFKVRDKFLGWQKGVIKW
jgi:NitT/TauT family transport system permease protein